MPSIEKLILFNPDWVVTDAAFPMPLFDAGVKAIGIPQFSFSIRSVDDLFLSTRNFLQSAYRETSNSTLDRHERCWRRRPTPPKRFRYLALAWAKPPILYSHATYLSDLLAAIGGTNIADDKTRFNFPQVSEEWLLRQDPERVYYLHETETAGRDAAELARKIWPMKKIELIAMDPQIFSRAGFRPLSQIRKLRPPYAFQEFCRETP